LYDIRPGNGPGLFLYNPGSRTGRQTRVLRPFDSSGGRSQQRNAATKGHKQYSELQKRKFNPTVNRKPSNHPISYRQQSTTITNKIHKRKPETRQNLRHCLASANHNSSSSISSDIFTRRCHDNKCPVGLSFYVVRIKNVVMFLLLLSLIVIARHPRRAISMLEFCLSGPTFDYGIE